MKYYLLFRDGRPLAISDSFDAMGSFIHQIKKYAIYPSDSFYEMEVLKERKLVRKIPYSYPYHLEEIYGIFLPANVADTIRGDIREYEFYFENTQCLLRESLRSNPFTKKERKRLKRLIRQNERLHEEGMVQLLIQHHRNHNL